MSETRSRTGETRLRTPLLLVRHGQTTWNVAGRWQGHADTPLTAEGEAQAQAAAAALAETSASPWRRLVASDLTRARATAEVIGTALGLTVELDPRLRERDVGCWSGRTRDEIAVSDPDTLAAFDARDAHVRPGGGESTHMLRVRALDFVRALVATRPGEPTIVVSHLGWIRSLAPDAPRENAARTHVVAEGLLDERAHVERGEADVEATVL